MNQFAFDLQRFATDAAGGASNTVYGIDTKAYNPDVNDFNNINGTLTYNSIPNKWLNTHRAIDMPNTAGGIEANKLAITTTNVSIYSNNMRIGFVQSFTPSESRDITPIQELGTEGVVQMVPGNTRGGQIQLQRVALYNSDIWNAIGLTRTGQFVERKNQHSSAAYTLDATYRTYGNPFRTLKDQRVPLELRAETTLPRGADQSPYSLIEIYFDGWIASYSKTIQVAQVWVTENVSIEYADMASYVKNAESNWHPAFSSGV